MKKTLLLSAIIVSFCVYFANAELAAFPICTTAGAQAEPDVSGSIVVWTDWRHSHADIYGYDLATKTEFAICTQASNQYAPVISGSTVVWVDERNGQTDIFAYNLSTQIEFPICTQSGWRINAAIDGEIVVWSDCRDDNSNFFDDSDIYGYCLSTQTEFPVCIRSGYQGEPDVSGNIVVWTDNSNSSSGYDIYGYDLTMLSEFTICTQSGDQFKPAVDGSIVVWTDYRNGNADIYAYNLTTHEEFCVCDQIGGQYAPKVCGDLIVWHDTRSGNHDIYGYDLNTKTEFAVCSLPGDQMFPAVGASVIVWSDYVTDENIYGAFIDKRPFRSSDLCEDAVPVIDNEPFYGTNRYATGTDISSCGYNDTHDVWNRYTPARGGTVTITTEGSTFDTVLGVYEGCGGAELACNDDYTLDNPWSRIVMDVVKGKTYYIRVAGFNGEAGDYDLLITPGACTDRPQSDVTGDCKVNLEDFMILASEWLSCGYENPEDC
jgi:beta propeller repeat protein